MALWNTNQKQVEVFLYLIICSRPLLFPTINNAKNIKNSASQVMEWSNYILYKMLIRASRQAFNDTRTV